MSVRHLCLLLLGLPALTRAQEHAHHPAAAGDSAATAGEPRQAGQAAFAAIAEVVRILQADSTTDWSRVDIEALRRHLMDMDDVTLRSTTVAAFVPGGARFRVTGEGRTVGAIRRMAAAHARMVSASGSERVTVSDIPSGALVQVLASRPDDPLAVARIRGLGFVGLLTLDAHHGPHHLALARGATPDAHQH